MFISNLREFFSQLPENEYLLNVGLRATGRAKVYYVTAGIAGGSCTASHFREALADWEENKYFVGIIETGAYVPETGETSVSLYAVVEQ